MQLTASLRAWVLPGPPVPGMPWSLPVCVAMLKRLRRKFAKFDWQVSAAARREAVG